MNNDEPKYRTEILKMMFVAGELDSPSAETTMLVEKIVRDQTIQIISVAGELAARRGQPKFTINDLLFQVRHNPDRLSRLQNHLLWKQIRKKARIRDGEVMDGLDPDDVARLVEDNDGERDDGTPGEADYKSGSESDSVPDPQEKEVIVVQPPTKGIPSIPPLPWSVLSMFRHTSGIPSLASIDDELEPRADGTPNPWLLARLAKNDERTRGMTAQQYATWAECRSVSFTFRKRKKFREWCGLGVIAEHVAKEDVLEILGFLTSEWVQTLTERALVAKLQEANAAEVEAARVFAGMKRKRGGCDLFLVRDVGVVNMALDSDGFFPEDKPIPATPIQPRHVRKAFEELQIPPKKYTAMASSRQLRHSKGLRIF